MTAPIVATFYAIAIVIAAFVITDRVISEAYECVTEIFDEYTKSVEETNKAIDGRIESNKDVVLLMPDIVAMAKDLYSHFECAANIDALNKFAGLESTNSKVVCEVLEPHEVLLRTLIAKGWEGLE